MRTPWLPAAAALAACQPAPTPEQATEAARPAIEAALADYGRYYSAGNTDSLVAMHATGAHVMPPNAPATHGTDAVRQMFAQAFQQPGGTLTLRNENLTVSGPVAIERGRWNFTPAAGAPFPPDSGKYLTHWHQTGGRWLISEVIWNSDLPPPVPAPAPAPAPASAGRR
jgi:ketosteroid isomerase-like protein